jgi:hypothetical protein
MNSYARELLKPKYETEFKEMCATVYGEIFGDPTPKLNGRSGQAILYNDPRMQDALALNQFAWASGFPSGVYMENQLTLSAQCKAKEGRTSFFSRLKNARLWVVEERMQFVYQAADRFDELLRSRERPYVEESLRRIAAGGGVA